MGDKSQRDKSLRDKSQRVLRDRKSVTEGVGGSAESVVESLGEGDLVLAESSSRDSTMEGIEALREFGRVMAENMNRQMQEQKEINKEREERNLEKYKTLVEGQIKGHREDAEIIAREFEKIRLDKENNRGKQLQKLPVFDGIGEVDEWVERIETCSICNEWSFKKMLEQLPSCLTGQAKRAFDSLTADEKATKEVFYQNMRLKIDPYCEKKNKENFRLAKRGNGESMNTFVNRLRMYIKRSGGDPKQDFAEDILKYRVYDNMSPSDRKLLNATIEHSEDLGKIIAKADLLLTNQPDSTGFIGVVTEYKGGDRTNQAQNMGMYGGGQGIERMNMNTGAQRNTGNVEFNGNCWQCNSIGHTKRNCPQKVEFNGMCWQCNIVGHTKRNCPQNASFMMAQGRGYPMYETNLRNPGTSTRGMGYRAQAPYVRPPFTQGQNVTQVNSQGIPSSRGPNLQVPMGPVSTNHSGMQSNPPNQANLNFRAPL